MLDDEFLALVACFHLVSDVVRLDLDLRTLQIVNDLYIDARYPGDLRLLPSGRPTLEDARRFYQFALEVYRKARAIVQASTPHGTEFS